MMNVLLLFSCISSAVVGVQVIGYRGETFNITCPYESGYETNKKYLCKGECGFMNKNIIVESGSPAKDRRFSLIDDTTARVFTVTITDLRTHDVGTYWCGVSTSLRNVLINSEIILFVKLDDKSTVQPTKHLVAITPSYFSTSVFNLQSTGIKPTDQSLSSTDSISFAVGLVVVLLVLCSGLFLFLNLWERKCGTVSIWQNKHQNGENVFMYEEIPDGDLESCDVTVIFNQTSASHLTDILRTFSVYAKVTNQQSDLKLTHIHSANQVTDACYLASPEPSLDIMTATMYIKENNLVIS
ncbi:CMRF35-like molecule 3 [Triplophysa dalaica]|uniref:CMRF35-like molecule 3 n=1 Tax=Triplophysa dalaica TaxID=1582913 RepID=UPI0024DFECAB|nr:CMRF35-like molecule 3 [Triplophysa dalaica]